MLLGFKRCFAPFVEDGSKTYTIRGIRKIPPKVGETCHCYVDPRQKTMRMLGRWPCVKVEHIQIGEFGDRPNVIYINGHMLAEDESNALAWRDGFRSHGTDGAFAEMMEFWRARMPFTGHLIHWKYTDQHPNRNDPTAEPPAQGAYSIER